MKKCPAYIAAALLAASCIYPYTPELPSETTRTVVVDGEILVGGVSTIRLSYLTPLNVNGATTGVPRGRAWVEDENGQRFDQPTSELSGIIYIPTGDAVPGRNYRAVIEVDGNTYTSDWVQASPAPVIQNVSFRADETNVTVYVDVDAEASQSGYLGFSYEETWKFHSEFLPDYVIDPNTWSISPLMSDWPNYWCYRSYTSAQRVLLDYTALEGSNTQSFPVTYFARTDSRNHQRYSILVKAYSLSRDAYLYNKMTQDISDLGGDLFSPDPGTLPSNLSCQNEPERAVMGLVLAAEVASKRVYMDNSYLIVPKANTSSFVVPSFDDFPRYYNEMNYRPILTISTDTGSGIGWGPLRCIDCIAAGGTQEKPDFWEE